MARFFRFTPRHTTHVFTCVIALLILTTLPVLAGGCTALDRSASPAGMPTGRPWADAAHAVFQAAADAVTPINPIVGGAFTALAAGTTLLAVKRGRTIKSLKTWNGTERRTKPRDVWDAMRREKYRASPVGS